MCCVCKRDREVFKEVVLSGSEREAVTQLTGKEPLDKYVYCKACWELSVDKAQGPQLMKGLLQLQFARGGVRGSEALAEKIRQRMLQKASNKPVS
jgi:hypothetical protein